MSKRDDARQAKQETRDRIVSMRARGQSFAKIAETLNREGVPTMRGGSRWHGGSIRTIVLAESPEEQRRVEHRHVADDDTIVYSCGVCGEHATASRMVYSHHTGNRYCFDLTACLKRRDVQRDARRAAAA